VTGVRPLRVVAIALLALAAGCATNAKKKSEKPAELTEFLSSARVEVVWSANLQGGAPKLGLGLSPAVAGNVVYAANHTGSVFAFDQASGKRLWRTATRLKLTGGPGVGEGLVVVGSDHGQVVALDAATGAIKWKSSINSELLAAPAIAQQVVLMRAVDGRLVALRATDGTQMWSGETGTQPRLSLRGTARPSIAGELALSGFDNGRVAAFRLSDGTPVWETNVAPSGGRTELERLNDIDTQLAIRGNDIYVVAFQGKAARLDLESGEMEWSRDESSYSGLALDEEACTSPAPTAAWRGLPASAASRPGTTTSCSIAGCRRPRCWARWLPLPTSKAMCTSSTPRRAISPRASAC